MDELNVGVRDDADEGGGCGVGSEGSGKVLERLRPRGRGGVFIGKALGGAFVGVRVEDRGGLWVWFDRDSSVGEVTALLDVSSVGLGVSNEGEAGPLLVNLLSGEEDNGMEGNGASTLDFEAVRVCKAGVGRAGAVEEETIGGLARALLAAVGSVSLELLAKGTVGRVRREDTGGTGGAAFGATNGVPALLEGALFVENSKPISGRGGKG